MVVSLDFQCLLTNFCGTCWENRGIWIVGRKRPSVCRGKQHTEVLWESARKIYCHSKSRVRGLNMDLNGFI